MKNSYKFLFANVIWIMIIGLVPKFGYSQTFSKVILEDKRGKAIYELNEGERVTIVTIDNDQVRTYYIGKLKIINDSILAVDGNLLRIDSIHKIGKRTKTRSFFGGILNGFGLASLSFGVTLLGISFIPDDPLYVHKIGINVGSCCIGVGTFLAIIGKRIVNGSPKRVKFGRKIKLVST